MNIGILAHVLSEQPFTFKDFIMAAVIGGLVGVLIMIERIYLHFKNKKEQKEQQEQKENNTE